MKSSDVESALRTLTNPQKAEFFPRFFRTGPGDYGEGDQFIGVVVPNQRAVAKQFKELPLNEIEHLLESPFHECRLTGLLILVSQFEKSKTPSARKRIYDFYVSHSDRVNNWDLVDCSCHKIMGPFLLERNRSPLFRFAKAKCLWKNRISIVTTYHFIRHEDFDTTIQIGEILVEHEHDLIHKAVGWMLRELGKKNRPLLMDFLERNHDKMPRTMLRYSIEKFPPAERTAILDGRL